VGARFGRWFRPTFSRHRDAGGNRRAAGRASPPSPAI